MNFMSGTPNAYLPTDMLRELRLEEVARLEALRQEPVPDFRVGDTLRVQVRVSEGGRERLQAFEGVCIARDGGDINESFTVRKISFGEGVERVFPLHAPVVASIEVKRRGRVRRAKLYYLRDRQGRSARIPERRERPAERELVLDGFSEGAGAQTSGPHASFLPSNVTTAVVPLRKSLLAYPQGEPLGDLQAMVASLKQLQALRGEAEGADALAALTRAVDQLPVGSGPATDRADLYEYARSIGEHLCPLMFSTDDRIATCAREGLQKLGPMMVARAPRDDQHQLALVLRHLEVAVVLRISIRKQAGKATIHMTARDAIFAAAKLPGLKDAHPVRLQMLMKTLGEEGAEVVVSENLGAKSEKQLDHDVYADADGLGAKLITVLADGREVFRCKLTRAAERVLVF